MKYIKDELGNRMKFNYEEVYKIRLPHRLPLIIRIDGKSFHTWTKHCQKPFDLKLINAMQQIAIEMFKHSSGCKLAYGQSDEISFLFNNFENLTTEPWFLNELQKIVSVTASIASAKLSKYYQSEDIPIFDARAFVLPVEEVENYFIWRQQDAERNSLSSYCHSFFTSKELNGKNKDERHEMLQKINKDWYNLNIYIKRGWCVVNKEIDNNIPNFIEHREYINKHLLKNE